MIQQVAQMMHARDIFTIRKTCRNARELCDFMWLDPRSEYEFYAIVEIALYNREVGLRLFRAKIADIIANLPWADDDYRVYYIIANMRMRASVTGNINGLRELMLAMIDTGARSCDLLNLLRTREQIRGKIFSTVLGEREKFYDTHEVEKFYCMWRELSSDASLSIGFAECLRSSPNIDILQFALEDTKNYAGSAFGDEENFEDLRDIAIRSGAISADQIRVGDHSESSIHKGGFTRVIIR